ncbi:MAG: TetR/AcrR family transcriptional regulator [Chloroflexota bacterium]|nr:TetR/AcrR family transcriptional regulator [Chloroflexota bacterium]
MTGTRQAARSEAAREQIVQAALTVFALKGYAIASMDDLCLAAGMSKGGLYHHFPTKRSVLSGVVEKLIRDQALLPPVRFDEGELALRAPALGRVLIEVWAEASRDNALRERLQTAYAAYVDGSLQTAGVWALADVLRVGTLIELLTRGEVTDAEAAAGRLGIQQAA